MVKGLHAGLLGLTLVSGALLPPASRQAPPVSAAAAASSAPAAETPRTTAADQVDLAVTVYNSNLALVRDARELTFPAGPFDLQFMDVASTINPATVHLRSVTAPGDVAVIEQNYEYDLLEPEKLLRKYVGREVTLVRQRTENGSTRTEEVKALLLSTNNGPVWKIGDEIVTGLHPDHMRFPAVPGNLFSRPTLIWKLENAGPSRQRVEASYLAGGLSWSADYVLTVGRDDRTAELGGWVTLANNSGTGYRNATLQLVAGDLHRTQEAYRREADMMKETMVRAAAAPQFAQEAFSEYHLYTLQRRTSVNDQQTKQIAFLTAGRVPVEKRFVVEGQQAYYRNRHNPGSPLKDVVKVYYRFRNDQQAGLAVPMPAGVVRVYQADARGSIQFAGEDRMSHTPKDETVNLYTGNAFDVVCERRQTDFRKIADDLYEMAFEITLRNHKEAPIVVEVNEPIAGDWEMLDATHRWTKADAWAARFSVPVGQGGASVLRYRVRVRW